MSMTAENIRNVRNDGAIDKYIEHKRNLIATLDSAEPEVTTCGLSGGKLVKFGTLIGRVSIATDYARPKVISHSWADDYRSMADADNFPSQDEAIAHAVEEMTAHFRAKAAALRDEAARDLVALEAAR